MRCDSHRPSANHVICFGFIHLRLSGGVEADPDGRSAHEETSAEKTVVHRPGCN